MNTGRDESSLNIYLGNVSRDREPGESPLVVMMKMVMAVTMSTMAMMTMVVVVMMIMVAMLTSEDVRNVIVIPTNHMLNGCRRRQAKYCLASNPPFDQ